jgi:transglutaminase-like putative cysteine protease
MSDFQKYLVETEIMDFSHPLFDLFIDDILSESTQLEQILALYLKVRDGFLYDPYHLDLRPPGLKASHVLGKKRAWCVEKAIVFAAGARKLGVPSRLGYAIVKNHIGVEKLESYLKRPEIVFHGYVEVYLNDKWVSCTPAFDQRICRLSKVPPLDFDGINDSMFQAFADGNKYMEYVHYYGTFDDVPVQLMNDEMQKYYPHLFEKVWNEKGFSFFHL